jgi:hypothetical protein
MIVSAWFHGNTFILKTRASRRSPSIASFGAVTMYATHTSCLAMWESQVELHMTATVHRMSQASRRKQARSSRRRSSRRRRRRSSTFFTRGCVFPPMNGRMVHRYYPSLSVGPHSSEFIQRDELPSLKTLSRVPGPSQGAFAHACIGQSCLCKSVYLFQNTVDYLQRIQIISFGQTLSLAK